MKIAFLKAAIVLKPLCYETHWDVATWRVTISVQQEVDEVDESEALFSRPTSHVAPAIEKNVRERWYGFYW